MFLNVLLGRLEAEGRNGCVLAIAGAVQVDINATMLELAAGPTISAKEVLAKVATVAGNTIQTAFTDGECEKTLLNKSVIAKALAAQTNVFQNVIEGVAVVYELAEFYPFVLAQTDPLTMSNKMQVYKGRLVPG